eukprot:4223046-Amphidinium_carterae.2
METKHIASITLRAWTAKAAEAARDHVGKNLRHCRTYSNPFFAGVLPAAPPLCLSSRLKF